MRRISAASFLALFVLANSSPAQQLLPSDGYGSLSGTVKLVSKNGALPIPADLIPNMMKHADKACCLDPKAKPNEKVDLAWVVDPKTKGVANVMVYLTPPKGKYFPTPDKLKVRKEKIVLDQPHCQFLPRVSAYQPYYKEAEGKTMETGQTLTFKNSAAVNHNVRVIGNGIDNDGFNINVVAGTEYARPKDKDLKPQKLPLEVRCDIHTWMTARIFVFDHPYYALTDKDGKFEIPMVPAGAEVTVMAWHEGVGYVIMRKEGEKNIPGMLKTIEKGKTTTLDLELQYNPGN